METCYTREQIEKAMESLGHKYFHHGAYNVNIIGVRNAATGDEITNKFDDCMTISYKDDNGDWHFNCWKCTTDPGKYWAEHLLNKDGVAILKEGQYRGSHKIRKHQGKYDALCQKGPVKVYRDKNMDDEYDLIEENVHEGVYGINIHKAGSPRLSSARTSRTRSRVCRSSGSGNHDAQLRVRSVAGARLAAATSATASLAASSRRLCAR